MQSNYEDLSKEDHNQDDSGTDESLNKFISQSSQRQPLIFPLTRVKKIMKADPELTKCTNESLLATSAATVPILFYPS